LIILPENKGSGFYLNTEEFTYLITAQHVLFEPGSDKLRARAMELLSYPKDPSDAGRYVLSVDLGALESDGNVISHPV
jgi:hypothetical protein